MSIELMEPSVDMPLSHAGNGVVARPSMSWRSIALGLLGVALISGLTSYNDYALNNAAMVGNNLPIGVMLYMFVIVVGLNAPLSRFVPRHALSTGELVISFSMTLVACGLPSAGLIRYLPSALIAPFWMSSSPDYLEMLKAANPPRWLFPQMSSNDPSSWASDPVATGFINRWTGPGPIPYSAWTTPILCWAIFIFALYGALLCIVLLVRRQWFENERLAFPLVEIHLSLLEAPEPNHGLNKVLSSKAFWAAFGVIFFIHLMNGCANYWPQYVPRIPLGYNLSGLTADAPWSYIRWHAKSATIFFTVVGATYFMPLNISFSLWFFFVLEQIYGMFYSSMSSGGDPYAGTADQHYGSVFVYAAAFIWLGRRHWMLILRQAFRGRRAGEPVDPYISYPWAFWVLIACTIVMIGWMMAAGCTGLTAVVAVITLLLLFTVITRIVAEVGLIHGMLIVHLSRVWDLIAMSGLGKVIPLKSYFVNATVDSALFDFREVVSVYSSHSLKIADETNAVPKSRAWKFIGLLALSMVLAYFISFYSMLHTEYTHAVSLDSAAASPINTWATTAIPRWYQMDASTNYHAGRFFTDHNVFGHIAAGAAIMGVLSYLRVTFVWWPLHPIGYLMLGTFPGNMLWFSVFLGWLAKRLVIWLGGSSLFSAAKPFFLGLVVGESLAAGLWMAIGMLLSSMGVHYTPINIMPG